MSKVSNSLGVEQTIEELDKISPSACVAKFVQSTIYMHSGINRGCHHSTFDKIDIEAISRNPHKLHDSPAKPDERLAMLKGQRPEGCTYCWKIEEAGGISDRVFKSSQWWAFPELKSLKDQDVEKTTAKTLELSFQNTCNLRCIYCGPQSSSSWIDEYVELGPYDIPGFNDQDRLERTQSELVSREDRDLIANAFWQWWPELSKSLKILRLTGGEPLLSPHTWKVFEELKKEPCPQMNLAINSNFGVDASLIDKLIENVNSVNDSIGRFTAHVSMESVGERAEYIRYPIDFELFERNVLNYLNNTADNCHLSFMSTIQIFNGPYITEWLEWVYDLRKKYPRRRINVDLTPLIAPAVLQLRMIGPEYSSWLEEPISFVEKGNSPFKEWELIKLKRIKKLIETPLESKARQRYLKRFVEVVKQTDARRNLNTLKVFPLLSSFYEECLNQ